MESQSQRVANPLHITVRFTNSIPDLPVDVAAPSKTTVISLKHLIRAKLPPPDSLCRLRLIYSGKILPDTAIITSVLKVPPPPPRPAPDPKGKGKNKAFEELPVTRVYVNCSIGDILTEEELSAEATAATTASKVSFSGSDTGVASGGGGSSGASLPQSTSSTTTAPRGFDRLLTTGFTPAEVGQLRLQFLSIQARIHTPDTMPSPTSLRRMEDAWIDDNGGAGTGDAGGIMGDGGEVSGGALDDLLWGHLTAFFWPLGSLGWLIREEGVWSERRQYAVFTGFMLSLAFGMMHVLS